MPKTSTPVDEQLFAFLATKTTPEDDYLRDLRAADKFPHEAREQIRGAEARLASEVRNLHAVDKVQHEALGRIEVAEARRAS